VLRAENISVQFRQGLFRKKLKALDGFSMSVERGDVFGLLGPNGAGKSTAMYCLLGLIKPDSGSISVFGKRPYPGADLFKHVAYLPEEPHYHMYLTVEEAISYYAALYGKSLKHERLLKIIDRVGLSEFRKLRLSKCSKGMKQKVGIAQCLIRVPRLLLLDEPTRGLDPMMVKDFRNILLYLNKKGTTILLNSHILSEIEMICNRVAIMKGGKMLAQEKLKNLLSTDLGTYEVDFRASGSIPDYVKVTHKSPDSCKAEIPAGMLDDFMGFIGASGSRLYSCAVKKNSLEDVFYKIMKVKA
jgi:ABC-2 type transport system ATP-binding protein